MTSPATTSPLNRGCLTHQGTSEPRSPNSPISLSKEGEREGRTRENRRPVGRVQRLLGRHFKVYHLGYDMTHMEGKKKPTRTCRWGIIGCDPGCASIAPLLCSRTNTVLPEQSHTAHKTVTNSVLYPAVLGTLHVPPSLVSGPAPHPAPHPSISQRPPHTETQERPREAEDAFSAHPHPGKVVVIEWVDAVVVLRNRRRENVGSSRLTNLTTEGG